MIKLRECKLCDKSAKVGRYKRRRRPTLKYYVYCTNENCDRSVLGRGHVTEQEAIEEWNGLKYAYNY